MQLIISKDRTFSHVINNFLERSVTRGQETCAKNTLKRDEKCRPYITHDRRCCCCIQCRYCTVTAVSTWYVHVTWHVRTARVAFTFLEECNRKNIHTCNDNCTQAGSVFRVCCDATFLLTPEISFAITQQEATPNSRLQEDRKNISHWWKRKNCRRPSFMWCKCKLIYLCFLTIEIFFYKQTLKTCFRNNLARPSKTWISGSSSLCMRALLWWRVVHFKLVETSGMNMKNSLDVFDEL